jgi:chromosome segregation ATPase
MKKFFMSLLWVLLFAALGALYFYQTTFDNRLINMNSRAKNIEDKYQTFTDAQHDFDVRLIGHRKHINQNSQRFLDLQDELKKVRDQHSSDMFYVNTRIDSLASIVVANHASMRNRVDDVDRKVNSLRQTVTQNNVRTTQQLQDLVREIERLQAQITHLDTTTQKLRRR